MRTVFFIAALAFFHSANAQEHKKLRVGFAVGYINPALPRAASLEAAYRFSDRISIGYRLETASLSNNSINSSALYSQFYFVRSQRNFRPFVGLGAGQFKPGDMSGGCSGPMSQRVNTEKKIGFFPRIGFDVGHLSIMVDANLAVASKSTVVSSFQPSDINYHAPYTEYLANSYVVLKIGFFFGGGKKKNK